MIFQVNGWFQFFLFSWNCHQRSRVAANQSNNKWDNTIMADSVWYGHLNMYTQGLILSCLLPQDTKQLAAALSSQVVCDEELQINSMGDIRRPHRIVSLFDARKWIPLVTIAAQADRYGLKSGFGRYLEG